MDARLERPAEEVVEKRGGVADRAREQARSVLLMDALVEEPAPGRWRRPQRGGQAPVQRPFGHEEPNRLPLGCLAEVPTELGPLRLDHGARAEGLLAGEGEAPEQRVAAQVVPVRGLGDADCRLGGHVDVRQRRPEFVGVDQARHRHGRLQIVRRREDRNRRSYGGMIE